MLTIPSSAILEENGKSRCVVVDDGKAARRPIVLGLNDGTRAEVVTGLSGNESVVKANAASLAEGQAVQIIEPATSPSPGAKP